MKIRAKPHTGFKPAASVTLVPPTPSKELLKQYGELIIELYNTGDSMAASQAVCDALRKIEEEILYRMEKTK